MPTCTGPMPECFWVFGARNAPLFLAFGARKAPPFVRACAGVAGVKPLRLPMRYTKTGNQSPFYSKTVAYNLTSCCQTYMAAT